MFLNITTSCWQKCSWESSHPQVNKFAVIAPHAFASAGEDAWRKAGKEERDQAKT